MKALNTDKAPAAIGPYSQAIRTGNLVFVSGQLPIIPETGAFPEGGIKEQTKQSLLNARAILQSEGLDLNNVVKTTVFLSEIANFGPMNEVYAEFFTAPFPARCAFAVKDLPKGALVEIELIAPCDISPRRRPELYSCQKRIAFSPANEPITKKISYLCGPKIRLNIKLGIFLLW